MHRSAGSNEEVETGGPWVLPMVAITSGIPAAVENCTRGIEAIIGPIADRSPAIPFETEGHYYVATMGPGLTKTLIVAESLRRAVELSDWKLAAIALEKGLAETLNTQVPRPVNLDPGYLDFSRFVLASTKDAARRIYLSRGIFAEITLRFESGAWQPFPWTYRDYQNPDLLAAFVRFREHYRERIRQRSAVAGKNPCKADGMGHVSNLDEVGGERVAREEGRGA